jgi:hypothetical protein
MSIELDYADLVTLSLIWDEFGTEDRVLPETRKRICNRLEGGIKSTPKSDSTEAVLKRQIEIWRHLTAFDANGDRVHGFWCRKQCPASEYMGDEWLIAELLESK